MRASTISIMTLLFLSNMATYGYLTYPNHHKITTYKKASIIPKDKEYYDLAENLIVRVDNRLVRVPKGFVTDLATTPRFLWSFIAPNTASSVFPSILHDYLYSCTGTYSRLWVDEVFYSFLIEQGISKTKAYLMFLAVRIFGYYHFEKEHPCVKPRR